MAEHQRACASCGTANEEDARFCEGCGDPLGRVCGTCGVEANATARFCRACGAPLDDRVGTAVAVPAAGPSRKTVTVMFADLAGSTTFEEQVDAETAREVMSRYHNLLRTTAEHNRAGVTKYIGDGFMAIWGVPEIGPGDADRAVEAAVELQERFVDFAAHASEAHAVELALRVAVNTGEVVVGAGDADLVGDALNVAARLEAECPRGRVVVGEETWRSTRGRHSYESLGHVQVKGRTAPVAVYQWLGRQSESTDAPFVGRGDEVRRLGAALNDAVAAQAARLVTVIGDPGVGKSRLAAEFTGALDDARVVEARCDVEGTVALAPIVEVLRARDLDADVPAGVPERDRILRDLNGLTAGVPGSVEETFWALRRYIEMQARHQPLVIVVDDIQWADTLLLDFIEHLVEWVQDVPVLVLALARPELREVRPDLVTVSQWVTEAVHLGGLDPAATAELAAGVLGAARLPSELLGRLPSSTGGNPLFVRELVGMLVHDGVLVAEPAGWRLTIDVDAIAIPPTIQALLASRLERLNAADRRVLEIASVVGTDFSLGAVCALAERSSAEVKGSLDRLRRLELAQPSGAYLGDEKVWRFHHVLIRDVAYRRLLKSDRADLHERLADWLEAGGASVAFDPDEMIARHLESAHGYRLELSTADEHTGELALRSARRYLASARRALDRDELVSAGTQAARGAALAAADGAVHAELLLVGCEAFLSAGDVTAGAPLVDDLDRIAGEPLAPWATCYRCQFVVYTDPERLLEVDARLQSAIDEFGRRKDNAGLAKAHRVRASARARLGRVGDAEVDLFEALIAARQGGDHRQITAALGMAPGAALWGPSPVPKAGGRCLDVVRMQRMTTAAPSLEATSLRCLAVLELLRGRPDKARSMLADARQVVADLGLRHGLMETELFAGFIESMVGNQVAAEPHFRTAMEGMDALGVGADAGQAAALLARSVLAQGRLDEADRYAAQSEHLAGHNLKTAIAWRAVRAEILAAQGRHDDAVAMAKEAVAVAAGTDLVLDHAEACLALSRVLATAGDAKGANRARGDAETLYAAKEVAISIERPVEPVTPAAPKPAPATSRLAITNRATQTVDSARLAMQAHDVDAAIAVYADRFVYDDRRLLSGDAIETHADMRAACDRVLAQYPHLESRTLAVRGDRLTLAWSRWWDDTGNETTYLHVYEIGDDGRITYDGRFDEDDCESASRELERRYYAGEGATFAANGRAVTQWMESLDRVDVDAARRLAHPEFRWIAPPSSLKSSERSVDELFRWLQERANQVSSMQHSNAVLRWLTLNCNLSLGIVRAAGPDGEAYEWTRIYVSEFRDGLLASVREFELDDEDAAFAYAETLVASPASRLTVSNRASESVDAICLALQAHDVQSAVAVMSDQFVYDDRRRLTGDPIEDIAELRNAGERLLEQYSAVQWRTQAVRGDRLALIWSRWSDDAGNEAAYLGYFEIDGDGRITHHIRFDGDDFEGAYRELEHRYYAGEGAAFATNGHVVTEFMAAMDRLDVDAARSLAQPEFRWQTVPTALSPTDLTVDDLFRWLQARRQQVSSVRHWGSAVRWLSPNCFIGLGDARAVGLAGEDYLWTRLYTVEYRDGLLASVRQFELDDEDAAFAYAESLVSTQPRRLAVRNRASETIDRVVGAMQTHDVHRVVECYGDPFTYDDRRRLSGDPFAGRAELRVAVERILAQYTRFEARTLAVRGERLQLHWSRSSDDAGNESTQLHLIEVDHNGRIVYEGRFDEDDFEGAYRGLERRYYAGEGAAFAEEGAKLTEVVIAHNRGDLARVFDELCAPELRIENRSRSAFPNRSAAELRASTEELQAMFASVQMCYSAVCWLSRNWAVARQDREAVGSDGEKYEWVQLYVTEFRDGLATSIWAFDVEDEEAAFAYAEERVRAAPSRLALTNRTTEVGDRLVAAMNARDIEATINAFSDQNVYDDRRRLSGDPIEDRAGLRGAFERIFEQYSVFESRTLAVRAQRLALWWSRWSDDSRNETDYLHVFELGDDGRIVYAGRFDEDDFEGAYRELERRYYAGEGAEFAEQGAVGTEWVMALNQGDFDRVFNELTHPFMRVENRSLSVFGDPSAAELRATFEELYAMVASARAWSSAVCWLSPMWGVARFEREAVGRDGEKYAWARLQVIEFRDGRLASLCRFEVDDEEAAFAYAEEQVRAASSRLAVTNRARESVEASWRAIRAHNVDAVVAGYSNRFVYEDRRRLNGDPVVGLTAMRAAIERIFDQYSQFELRVLAVRGERLILASSRWSDDAGNETSFLHVAEIADDGLTTYDGRFDEDDFEGAYRELERRYYAGEGAEFAEAGAVATDWILAMNCGDFDRAFGELSTPDMRVENRSRVLFPDRSAAELRASFEELSTMVASARTWISAMHWVSPTWLVFRLEREAVGQDGEAYQWLRLHACEIQNGRLVSVCQFEMADEEQAFAYAEERERAAPRRLAVTNRASATINAAASAAQGRDLDAMFGWYSDGFTYDDRRRLTGIPPALAGDALRLAQKRILEQYNHFETRTLAVRGERLHLGWGRWSNEAGYETTHLYVHEVGESGLIEYEGRFDEDDFDGAYRELERRYYAGEGATFAEGGAVATEWVTALNRGDFDRLLGELSTPEMRVENQSRSAFPNRSAAELRASFEALDAMVASTRTWLSVAHWLSPTWCVALHEREAVGREGEQYAWTQLLVGEFRNGRIASIRQFELDDEEAAFAYAEERMRAAPSRLAVTNRGSKIVEAGWLAIRAHNVDGLVAFYSDRFEYDDRRRLSGGPRDTPAALRAAVERLIEQYPYFEWRTLAVRGERLGLHWSRWRDDAGNESAHLHVFEIGDDGRITYDGRFDEDDFEDAYRELERRYYAGEGAAFADGGAVQTNWITAVNTGDLDRVAEFYAPEMRVENRSRTGFPDRSASDLRASFADLNAMVASTRTWPSAVCWVSPGWNVTRLERKAVGTDGEQYDWTRLLVNEFRDGLVTFACEFDLEDEAAAFAYAEEQVRASTSRLAVTNRSCETLNAITKALQAHDTDGFMSCCSDRLVYDDRRRLSGDPIHGDAEFRVAFERIFQQYNNFECRILAVRGERLNLDWTRWSDDAGNETAHLHVFEIGDDGRQVYEGRFDDDDFEGAYRELERRYYSAEGTAFAEAGGVGTEWVTALNRGDLDRLFGELTSSEMCVENRSSSVFPHLSAAELRATFEELNAMVTSARTWLSAVCWVSPACSVTRFNRQAVGRDGEQYAWTRLMVAEVLNGQLASMCEFELDDEEAAFGYAEERVRAAGTL